MRKGERHHAFFVRRRDLYRSMSQPHPDRVILERFIHGDLPAAEQLQVQRHLLLCEECEQLYLEISFTASDDGTHLANGPEESGDYTPVIERVLRAARAELARRGKVMSDEQGQAEEALRELLELPASQRLRRIEEEHRLQTWAVAERLIEICRSRGLEDPDEASHIGELAVQVSRRLDARTYGEGRVQDLLARAWSCLGNARRLQSDLSGAARAFRSAEIHLSHGSGDPSEEALMLELKACLLRSERRFDEALALFDEAVELYRLLTEPHLTGRALIQRGITLGLTDRVQEGIAALSEGLALIETGNEPRLELHGRHNLFCFLLEEGRLLEAQALLAEIQRGRTRLGGTDPLLPQRWLEGRLAAALDHTTDAEEALRETRDRFLAAGAGVNAALVSLELAALYARQGHHQQLVEVADALFALFQTRDLPREAIAALTLFQEAVREGKVTGDLIAEVSTTVRGGLVLPATLLDAL
jgi:tetratricopeptide (TPR) repeat protein